MPLQIEIRGDRAAPVIVCDHCRKPIRESRDGNYQWNPDDLAAGLFFTHKRCCAPFEAARPAVTWAAMELRLLPLYLENNLRIDRADAIDTARRLAELG